MDTPKDRDEDASGFSHRQWRAAERRADHHGRSGNVDNASEPRAAVVKIGDALKMIGNAA